MARRAVRCGPARPSLRAPPMTQQFRSRLRAQPRGRRILLTERDLELFRLLDRYRYLPSNFILAFLGGHPTYHRQRLTDLFHEGWLRKPEAQWQTFNARYRPNSYELSQKAKTALSDIAPLSEYQIGSGAPFWHEHLVCLVMASIELAARGDGIAMRTWRDVLARAPQAQAASAAPFSVSVEAPELKGSRRVLRPDGLPFGLAAARTIWFPGIEIDRHTEPLHPSDLRSRTSSILLKFVLYQQFVRERLFEKHYGLPNVMVPIVTVNDVHMRNMIELALSMSDGRGFKWMLFKSLPGIASGRIAPEPQRDILSAPWLRPGNPPVSLLEELRRG